MWKDDLNTHAVKRVCNICKVFTSLQQLQCWWFSQTGKPSARLTVHILLLFFFYIIMDFSHHLPQFLFLDRSLSLHKSRETKYVAVLANSWVYLFSYVPVWDSLEPFFPRAYTLGNCVNLQCDVGLSISMLAAQPWLSEIRLWAKNKQSVHISLENSVMLYLFWHKK